MAIVDILMPRMGESVMEGTIISWLKNVGDEVDEDESILEVATDKVDTEIPSPFEGTLVEILAKEGAVIKVGAPIAKIESKKAVVQSPDANTSAASEPLKKELPVKETIDHSPRVSNKPGGGRFYSPLVLNIARKEGIDMPELDRVPGSGKEGRVTKKDLLTYLDTRSPETVSSPATSSQSSSEHVSADTGSKPVDRKTEAISDNDFSKKTDLATEEQTVSKPALGSYSGAYDIIEMDRMRKIIADRMLESKQTSPHVTSVVEADVTNIVYWRNRWKTYFKEKENTALTFTPIFIEAVAKAIKDYPLVNVSVDNNKIIVKKEINIGMAVALPSGNLIVPVIRNADQLNIIGLTKKVNDLARRARAGSLKPEDLDGGTYTVTNVGSFGNLIGTPILVQPQVGILALGAVTKKPAVIETPHGDTLGIRQMMFLSHSYDHRVVDGSLGGMFVRRVADYLERFDLERKV